LKKGCEKAISAVNVERQLALLSRQADLTGRGCRSCIEDAGKFLQCLSMPLLEKKDKNAKTTANELYSHCSGAAPPNKWQPTFSSKNWPLGQMHASISTKARRKIKIPTWQERAATWTRSPQ
jgi:hypothetical protein